MILEQTPNHIQRNFCPYFNNNKQFGTPLYTAKISAIQLQFSQLESSLPVPFWILSFQYVKCKMPKSYCKITKSKQKVKATGFICQQYLVTKLNQKQVKVDKQSTMSFLNLQYYANMNIFWFWKGIHGCSAFCYSPTLHLYFWNVQTI